MRLHELLDPNHLAAEIAAGYVRAQHLDGLAIYNYTDKAQYDRHWNAITTQCRGLIVNPLGDILARPFPKFFNHNEPEAQTPNEPVIITDKMDGSLGISYVANGEVRIATRGSFTSEQALHATRVLAEKHSDWTPPAGVTALFEIIYPENRIVLDYGHTDDLVLLGGINISTGAHVSIEQLNWTGHEVSQLPYFSLREALAAPPRKNAEGMVVHFMHSDTRVKIKQEDYVRLHRIVTGWNERTIWEHLAAGESLDQLIAGLPDEFHRWATDIGRALKHKHYALIEESETEYRTLTEFVLPADWDRKEFAIEASKHPLRPALFSLLDGKDLTDWAWKQIRPTTQKEASLV